MRLLLTNDDGIDAPGMSALIDAFAGEAEVTVVAPASERSAAAHAILVHRPVQLTPRPDRVPGGQAWALDANPADCVKCALSLLLADSPPDLIVSGINRGQNTGNNVIYSGTIAGASEAAMYNRPAIALSLAALWGDEPDFSAAVAMARKLVPQVIASGLPHHTILSVNVPNRPVSEIAGVVWAHQGLYRYGDHFAELPEDNPQGAHPDGVRVLRNVGDAIEYSTDVDADDGLVTRGFIAITPLTCDRTDHRVLASPPDLDLGL